MPEVTLELDELSKNLTRLAALPTSTVTSTISPFKFLTIEETPQPDSAFEGVLRHHIISPNGQWAVVDAGGFHILHSSGETIWQLPLNAHEELGKGWGGVFFADQWSPDSRFLFFSRSLYAEVGFPNFRGNDSGYWQLDIVNGTIREILPAKEELFGRSIALSPSQEMLAYLTWGEPLQVVIRNVATLEERGYQVPGDYYDVGDILWSSNEEIVFYVVAQTVYPASKGNRFALFSLDIESEIQTMILERMEIPIFLDWFDENTLEVRDGDEEVLFFDLESKIFVEP